MKSLQSVSEKLNEICEKNLGKSLFAYFFMLILEPILAGVVIFPALPLVNTFEKGSLPFMAAVGYIIVALALIFFLFYYGFASMLLCMTQGRFVTMGFIFMGFKRLKKSLKPVLFFVFLTIISLAVAFGVSFLFGLSASSFFKEKDPRLLAAFLMGVAGLVSLFFWWLFAFVFQISFEFENTSLFSILRKNHQLLKGNRFTLIRLMVKAGGRSFLIACVAATLEVVLSSMGDENSRIVSLISLFLQFIYFINAYTALIRMNFAVPVLYDSLAHVEIIVEDAVDENRLVLEETAALLSDDSQKPLD